MKLDLGMDVCAGDGLVGTLRDLVVDPITMQLTHLVVDTRHGVGGARLIPFGAVDPQATVGRSEIVVFWTCAEVGRAPLVEHEDFVAIGPIDHAIGRIPVVAFDRHD